MPKLYYFFLSLNWMCGQTDRQTDRQTNRWTDRQTGKQTNVLKDS